MKVDIGIPTFRRPEGLRHALKTALAEQDGGAVGRIFAVNNDPDDRLGDVAREFPTVELISNATNLGATGNWNRVIELARARYLVILHDDDELRPGWLRRAVDQLEGAPDAAFAFCAVEIINAAGEVTRVHQPCRAARAFAGPSGATELLRRSLPIRAPGIVFRLDALRRAGGFSAECAELGDVELYVKLVTRTSALHDPYVGARYRFDVGNLTHAAMFRPRDLELFEKVRALLSPEFDARGADPARWNAALDQMAARHAILSALYRLKNGEKAEAAECVDRILAGPYRISRRWRTAARLLRVAVRVPGAANTYDVLRRVQNQLSVLRHGRG